MEAAAGVLAVAPHITAGSVQAVNADVLPVICRRFAADRDRMTARRPETVRANMEKVLANDLYRVCIGKEAAAVEIYKTDYTVTENQQPVITFTIK